jgi:hypothetical protein
MASETPEQPATSNPTRQQLDELEALMQRMLALPVNQLEDEAPVAIPALLANVPLAEPMPAWPPPAPTTAATERARTERVPEGDTALDSLPDSGKAITPARPVSRSTHRPISVRRRSRLKWPLMPLIWTNLAFDRCTEWLGRPGRWLRSVQGRAVLGWLGVFLLAAAAAWLIFNWAGWTW